MYIDAIQRRRPTALKVICDYGMQTPAKASDCDTADVQRRPGRPTKPEKEPRSRPKISPHGDAETLRRPCTYQWTTKNPTKPPEWPRLPGCPRDSPETPGDPQRLVGFTTHAERRRCPERDPKAATEAPPRAQKGPYGEPAKHPSREV